jgi:isochorismate synthase EntC
VEGTLHRDGAVPGSGGTVLRLLSLLHPTPAVGGVPRSEAVRLIAALEAVPRGNWAGVVGWVDADGDGEWMLAIRCALLGGRRARVYAGAGIVSGSRPDAELAETTLKLRPVLEALAPGWSALLL